MKVVAYIVRPGDTLWEISRRFGVPVNEIIRFNNILYTDQIYPGQRIIIPINQNQAPNIYIVRPGDTLFSIARRYNLSVPYILDRNDIPDPNLIYPGQVLNLAE